MIQAIELRAGDVLVGHSLPITSSLILDKKVKLDEGRFLDLCTLINALTLHDRLITLPATVSEDLRSSPLYSYLSTNGILQEVDFSYRNLKEENRREWADLLGDIVSESEVERLLTIITYSSHQFNASSISDENEINGLRSKFVDEVIGISKNLQSSADYTLPISGEGEKTYRIRTAEYWEASSELHLPFIPDFMRIPILAGYNIRLRQSIRMFIGSSIDEVVRKELEDASRISSPLIIPIPNATSIFLHRYYSSGNIEEAFNSMRDEFAEDRRSIIDWEKRIHDASNNGYGEVLSIIEEIRSSLRSITPADKTEILMSVGPGIAEDISHGIPSPGTSITTIKTVMDMVTRWRRRRRISYFNNGKKEASGVGNQHELLKFAFGASLTPRQIDRFNTLASYLQRLSDTE